MLPCKHLLPCCTSAMHHTDGTLQYKGRELIAMEDLCRMYSKPCVMDCKVCGLGWGYAAS